MCCGVGYSVLVLFQKSTIQPFFKEIGSFAAGNFDIFRLRSQSFGILMTDENEPKRRTLAGSQCI